MRETDAKKLNPYRVQLARIKNVFAWYHSNPLYVLRYIVVIYIRNNSNNDKKKKRNYSLCNASMGTVVKEQCITVRRRGCPAPIWYRQTNPIFKCTKSTWHHPIHQTWICDVYVQTRM